jgi:hypothetical protein
MCKFISGLIHRNGDICCLPEYTDSHEDLIARAGLVDNSAQLFARFEFTPPKNQGEIADTAKWILRIDEHPAPDWLYIPVLETRMRDRVSNMLIDKDQKILMGGCWIIINCRVDMIRSCRVYSILGSAHVGFILRATVLS